MIKILKKPVVLILLVLIAILVSVLYTYYISTITHVQSSSVTSIESSNSGSISKPPSPALSQTDSSARENILNKYLNGTGQSGIIYKSANVKIEYISAADIFQAEILTTNVAAAKTETESWFRKQGITQEGICNLPLTFYINPTIKEDLPTNDSQVNLLPDGC